MLEKAFEFIREGRAVGQGADYRLGARHYDCFAAISRGGAMALVLPLAAPPDGVARAAAGCSLVPVTDMEFEWAGRRWTEPAAILACDDRDLSKPFLVLADDVARRVYGDGVKPRWKRVAQLVDEWQHLLGRRKLLSTEELLGLVGELWVLDKAGAASAVLSGWRGPEGSSIDFLVDGVGLEVKATRRKGHHHFSQSQVDSPVGDAECFVLSLWVGIDPIRGLSVSEMVERVLFESEDSALFMRGLAESGYSFADKAAYHEKYLVLEARCYSARSIPRVTAADPGVGAIRYEADLSGIAPAPADVVEGQWFGCLL